MTEIDDAAQVRAVKQELRGAIGDVAGMWRQLEDAVRREADAIREIDARGRSPVPVVRFSDIVGNTVPAETVAEIRRRGTALIRGTIDRDQITRWNDAVAAYIDDNGYASQKDDGNLQTYFGGLSAKTPQIFAIYWSRPQVEARQHPNMAAARRFMNRLWRFCDTGDETTAGRFFFDPDREVTYADRVRRREPGDTTLGLSPHMDGGSIERWLDPGYRRVYRNVFNGDWERHDPFDGEFRVEAREFPAPNTSTFFRSYQGWLALTGQGKTDGTLQVVPMIRHSIAYLLLRPLLDDVPEELICGAARGKAQAILPQWHQPLIDAQVSIPTAEPGDTVWWHPDCIHAVGDEHRGTDYSNVMFIGAGPLCAKNAEYAARQRGRFLAGETPPDFSPEHRETAYRGRGGEADLTDLGRRQLGLEAWPTEGVSPARATLIQEAAAAAGWRTGIGP
ncbi:YbiU family protein [Inquilinus limosus]|uniref:YbiU family protein n=1 Tax=Inquilinus limosus TaxID=171674 RepID=UPI0009DD8226|nr:YbiU family protein [Inquilinus limosus]